MLFTVIFTIIYSALLLIERQTNDEKCVFSVAPRQTIIHSSQQRVRAVCIHQWDYVLRSTLLFYAIVHHLPFILSLLLSRSLALARLQCYYFLWSSFLRWRLFNLLHRKYKTSIFLAFLIVWHCLPSLIHLCVARRQESIHPYGFFMGGTIRFECHFVNVEITVAIKFLRSNIAFYFYQCYFFIFSACPIWMWIYCRNGPWLEDASNLNVGSNGDPLK